MCDGTIPPDKLISKSLAGSITSHRDFSICSTAVSVGDCRCKATHCATVTHTKILCIYKTLLKHAKFSPLISQYSISRYSTTRLSQTPHTVRISFLTAAWQLTVISEQQKCQHTRDLKLDHKLATKLKLNLSLPRKITSALTGIRGPFFRVLKSRVRLVVARFSGRSICGGM
jgi:hypothetical protein